MVDLSLVKVLRFILNFNERNNDYVKNLFDKLGYYNDVN